MPYDPAELAVRDWRQAFRRPVGVHLFQVAAAALLYLFFLLLALVFFLVFVRPLLPPPLDLGLGLGQFALGFLALALLAQLLGRHYTLHRADVDGGGGGFAGGRPAWRAIQRGRPFPPSLPCQHSRLCLLVISAYYCVDARLLRRSLFWRFRRAPVGAFARHYYRLEVPVRADRNGAHERYPVGQASLPGPALSCFFHGFWRALVGYKRIVWSDDAASGARVGRRGRPRAEHGAGEAAVLVGFLGPRRLCRRPLWGCLAGGALVGRTASIAFVFSAARCLL